ncbi:MAG: hypothetical protein ABI895_24780 [Deltaproteobacteria bacterium]
MTERSPSPRLRRLRSERYAGVIYVEVLVAIIPVLIFFFGLLQLALLYTSRLVVRHAAQRAVRSAVVILEDDPTRFENAGQGEISYHKEGSTSGGSTQQFLQGIGDVLEVDLPISDVQQMLSSEAGPRLAAIQRAAYMPLSTLAPSPAALLQTFGISGDSLGSGDSNLMQFLVGLLLYNRAAAMVTLRKPDGTVATCVGPTEDVTVRVTYLYFCTMPIAASIMCDSLMELSGLDQLDDAVKNGYEAASGGGLEGVQQAKKGLQEDLQRVSDTVGGLSRELQYAASPELLLPFLFSKAHFKLVSAEATLPNQGARYYDRVPCRLGGAASEGQAEEQATVQPEILP